MVTQVKSITFTSLMQTERKQLTVLMYMMHVLTMMATATVMFAGISFVTAIAMLTVF